MTGCTASICPIAGRAIAYGAAPPPLTPSLKEGGLEGWGHGRGCATIKIAEKLTSDSALREGEDGVQP